MILSAVGLNMLLRVLLLLFVMDEVKVTVKHVYSIEEKNENYVKKLEQLRKSSVVSI